MTSPISPPKVSNQTIQDAFNKRKKLLEQAMKYDVFIEAAQDVCEHDMVYNGHDSHYNHEICSKCGWEDLKC